MIQTEDYKKELIFIFFAQLRPILVITALIFFLAVGISYLWPPTYAAYSTILVKGKKVEKNPDSLEKAEIRAFPVSKEDLHSEAQLIESHEVMESTVRYLIKNGILPAVRDQDAAAMSEEIERIKSNLKIEIIPASKVLEITYNDRDSQRALTTLAAIVDQYIFFRQEVYSPRAEESFFTGQATKFRESLEKKEQELISLVEIRNVSDPQQAIENNLLIQKDLEQSLNLLMQEAINNQMEVEQLDSVLSNKDVQYFSFIENTIINNLSVKLSELTVERENLARLYNKESKKIVSLDEQLGKINTALKSEVEAYKKNLLTHLNIIKSKIESIQKNIDEIKAQNVVLHEQLIMTRRIQREADLLQFSYDTFAKRREEAVINAAMSTTNLSSYVSVLSNAYPSAGPVFPRKEVVVPLGLLIGFIAGCSIGFVREYFDHTFKKPSDVQAIAGLPVIFSIPAWRGGDKG